MVESKVGTMRKNVFKVLACMMVAGLATTVIGYQTSAKEEETIYPGVYLDGVYVGGLTKEQAMEEYDRYIDGIEDLKLEISTSVGTYETTLGEIGVSVSVEDAVDTAYHYGRQGNILSRYKEIKALEAENVVLVPEKNFNKNSLKDKLENETSEIVTAPQNASIKRENGEFIVNEGVVGTAIQVEDTVKAVEDRFVAEWKQADLKISAVVEETDPQYTSDDFYAIDSVLGQGSTEYSQGNTARSKNLATGASKISGTVLMPGEQFSVFNTVSPFNEENGYANAGQYVSNGSDIELVDGYGGGICQVSTTLYLAVLRAELQVDERYPHSLTVSYVKHGMDAAIAGDYMDFKFTNNTGYPVYIEGYAGSGLISFAIYGHETREEGRTISFESVDVETYEPGDPEETKDDTLEEGKTITEQAAHTGYYTELYKCVYKNGEQVSRELVPYGKSMYKSQKAKVTIGTKKKKKKKEDDDSETETESDAPSGDPEQPAESTDAQGE